MKRDEIIKLIKKERDGEFLYENFPSLAKGKKVRPQLGDFLHLKFSTLHTLSMLYYHPLAKYEFYRLGKLHGYISLLGGKNSSKKEFWNLSPLEIEKQQSPYWKARKFGLPKLTQMDKKKGILTYEVKETPSSLLSDFNQKGCFFLSGLLSGQIEAISGHPCHGTENKCIAEGHPCCEFAILLKPKEHLELPPINKENLKLTLDKLSESFYLRDNLEKEVKRKKLEDFVSISLNQSLNYTLSLSQGHIVLSKWAGKKLGERVVQKAEKNSLSEALNLLKDSFPKLKIGILNYELDPQRIIIKLEETVFSAGVKNPEMELEAFLEGTINGCLSEATNVDWIVKENKQAKRELYHEFICRTKEPEILRSLLLGG